jgi:hypothetical protein
VRFPYLVLSLVTSALVAACSATDVHTTAGGDSTATSGLPDAPSADTPDPTAGVEQEASKARRKLEKAAAAAANAEEKLATSKKTQKTLTGTWRYDNRSSGESTTMVFAGNTYHFITSNSDRSIEHTHGTFTIEGTFIVFKQEGADVPMDFKQQAWVSDDNSTLLLDPYMPITTPQTPYRFPEMAAFDATWQSVSQVCWRGSKGCSVHVDQYVFDGGNDKGGIASLIRYIDGRRLGRGLSGVYGRWTGTKLPTIRVEKLYATRKDDLTLVDNKYLGYAYVRQSN